MSTHRDAGKTRESIALSLEGTQGRGVLKHPGSENTKSFLKQGALQLLYLEQVMNYLNFGEGATI